MTQSRKIWITIIILLALTILGILFFASNATPPSAIPYSLDEPDVIAITEGTQGEINGVEIGVTFVDNSSAGISFAEAGDIDATAQNAVLEEQESINSGSYNILLLDAIPREQTAVFRVQKK